MKNPNKRPKNATIITEYAQVQEICSTVINGLLRFVIIAGPPGVGKGKSIYFAAKKKLENENALYIKGRRTRIKFFTELYKHQNQPIILDDADDVMEDSGCRGYIKDTTESDEFARLDYGSFTGILAREGVPEHFWTSSPVIIITNHWDEKDKLARALESRAEFFYFDPNWAELYRYAGTWFYDQEIFDYLYEKLPLLKRPDLRILEKAYSRKKANMKQMRWQEVIDNYCLSKNDILLRNLLEEEMISISDVCREWTEKTGLKERQFYNKLRAIKNFKMPKRIVLTLKEKPSIINPNW